MRDLETVFSAYLECAFWADSEDEVREHDPAAETLQVMRADCASFLTLIAATGADDARWSDAQLGYDFWLTRNGHGVGFWDRGHDGERLTEAAETFAECCLYVGDDGLVYCC